MKEKQNLKSMLGLSQDEMASYLKVNRSQWSMYQAGQRDLPLEAKVKFIKLLEHLKYSKETSELKQSKLNSDKEKTAKWILEKRINIKQKQYYLEKEIVTLKRKRNECFAAFEVIHYLEKQLENESAKLLAQKIKSRITTTLNRYPLYRLEEMELQKEGLKLMEERLAARDILFDQMD